MKPGLPLTRDTLAAGRNHPGRRSGHCRVRTRLREGRCTSREVCAGAAHACGTLAGCNAFLWAKRSPKATTSLFLICSFCKDLKPRSIKLHFHSWRSFSWLVIIFRSCLGKGGHPTAACCGCWGATAEAGWCSLQLLCKQKLLHPLSKGFVVPAPKQERQ